MMDFLERAPFVPPVRRPRIAWPDGARLAIWVVPNVEVFDFGSLAGAATSTPAAEPPDIPNHTWREYGTRVGIWRFMRILRDLDITATVALNARVCDAYPEVVRAMVDLGWEMMGHGRTNSESLSGLPEDRERAVVAETLDTIERFTGRRPTGWLGPALAETSRTLEVLAEHGVQYVGDWVNDEQPYELKLAGGSIVSMPYGLDVNDIGSFMRRGLTGPEYERQLRDQFDVLYEEAAETGKVMCVPLHPFLTGAPFRSKYLRQALAYMRSRPNVWFATGSQILAAYRSAVPA